MSSCPPPTHTHTLTHSHTIHTIHSLTHSINKLLRELEEQRDQCKELQAKLSTNKSEVEHLTRANQEAQESIQHLRGAVSQHTHTHCIGMHSISSMHTVTVQYYLGLFIIYYLFGNCFLTVQNKY